MEEKQGTISEIIFYNEENGYTIAVMETEDEYFTVVGCLPSCIKAVSYTHLRVRYSEASNAKCGQGVFYGADL